jgi:membrane-associated phospholipid phosphatase
MKRLGDDLKKLFVDWGKYYALPAHWKKRQWLLFVGFLSTVVVSLFFDEPIRYLFFTIHGPMLDAVFKFAHWFGTGFPTLYIFLGLYVSGLAFSSEKTRLGGLMLLQSYLYSGAITNSLKSIVGRWRPAAGHGHLSFTPFTTTPNAHLSFPSGDVAVVFSLAIVMAGLSNNKLWKALWIIVAVLTSLSRIYYDAHWFSDVVFSTVNAVVAGLWVVKKYKTENGIAG